ncbi:MAG TPA: M48 family metalloprotease [Terriglobales bacterium]|nr:M48 family metalloprotease [Terriglobales bacterium]
MTVESTIDPELAGLAYTKKLRGARQAQILFPLFAGGVYVYFGLHEIFALEAKAATKYFYVQVALCWIPLCLACSAGSLLASCYRFRIERSFRLANSTLKKWLTAWLKGNLLVFVLSGLYLEIVFTSYTVSPSSGWLMAALLSSALLLGTSAVTPWLLAYFYPVQPLVNEGLKTRLALLAKKAGLDVAMVYEWRISERTRKANAMVAGIGHAKRILVTDTLVSALSDEEVEALVAHELGHYALHHTNKRIAVRCLTFFAMFWLMDLVINIGLISFQSQDDSWTNLSRIPGILLVGSMAYLYSAVPVVALSRRQERAADAYGWKLVGGVDHFISAMEKLTDLNLVVFDRKSQWQYSHPTTASRIDAARKYAKIHFGQSSTLKAAVAGQ